MWQPHDCFPDADVFGTVWRYTDLAKFVSLLSTGKLFFARLSELEDPWEGRSSMGNLAPQWVDSEVSRMVGFMRQAQLWTSAQLETMTKQFRIGLEASAKDQAVRKDTAVNCWSLGEHEMDFFWRLYPSSRNGLAIRSTVGHLQESFQGEERCVYVGTITYIDYQTEAIPPHKLFYKVTHKSNAFTYEQEIRAAVWEKDRILKNGKPGPPRSFSLEAGEYVNVALDHLIDSIVISPYADSWFRDVVQVTLSQFGLPEIPVETSRLRTLPEVFKA
jgi:hypothetical protein